MSIVLLSIHPEFADKILCGEKRVEFRRRVWRPGVKVCVLYATIPIAQVVGFFHVSHIVSGDAEYIWETSPVGRRGIDRARFDEYIGAYGHAIHIADFHSYSYPLFLRDFGILRAPQSFCYVEDSYAHLISDKL